MTKPINLERVRYFPRQLMTAEDMCAEQDYFLERLRRHNRLLHGWGVVCGLQVTAAPTASQPWRVKVSGGYALSPVGDEIALPCAARPDGSDATYFDLAQPPGDYGDGCVACPCPPRPMTVANTATTDYLAIRYRACDARPTRVDYGRCGCSNNGCETTRYRDDFAFALLSTLPVGYPNQDAGYIDEALLKELERAQLVNSRLKDFDLAKLDKSNLSQSLRAFAASIPDSCGCDVPSQPYVILAVIKGDKTKPPPPLNLQLPEESTLEQRLEVLLGDWRRPVGL